ncbi:hypothetical protein BGZ95_006608, partial [Linnemannia exigua]
SFEFGSIEDDTFWNPAAEPRYENSIQDQLHPWEKDEAECGVPATIPRRLEPLSHLRILKVSDEKHYSSISESHIRSMLVHCPNLTDLAISRLWGITNAQDLAQDIAQLCPKLSSMWDLQEDGYKTEDLIVGLLRMLPQQQIMKIHCSNQDLGHAEKIFRGHSTTLRFVTLLCCTIDSKTVQTILVECGALEELHVSRNPYETRRRLCIDLEDAIEFPWACTRIRTLRLTVAIPDEPFHRFAENTVPYYNRPAPMELSVKEKEQFRSLEALY